MWRILAVALGVLLWAAPSWAAITHNEVDTGTGDTSALALSAQALATGELNVACFKWENAVTLNSITDTAGNTYTLLTNQTHSGNEPSARCGYVLSATGNATNVVTGNFSGTAGFARGIVRRFSYTGTMAFDVEAGSTEDTNDITPSSDSATTTGNPEVCIGFHADYTGQTFSNHTINGTAASGADNLSDTSGWYLISTTGGASSVERTATGRWVQRVSCFKETGGGPDVTQFYRRRVQ